MDCHFTQFVTLGRMIFIIKQWLTRWFPNEVQLVQDLADFEKLSDDEKHALKTVISYLNPNEFIDQ